MVPEQLSLLTACSSICLTANKLQSGWQYLLPQTRLQDLKIDFDFL
jgi:hypothetical protein